MPACQGVYFPSYPMSWVFLQVTLVRGRCAVTQAVDHKCVSGQAPLGLVQRALWVMDVLSSLWALTGVSCFSTSADVQ